MTHSTTTNPPRRVGIMAGWHTYSLNWSPDEYVFYIDGKETWRSKAGGVCQVPLFIKLSDQAEMIKKFFSLPGAHLETNREVVIEFK